MASVTRTSAANGFVSRSLDSCYIPTAATCCSTMTLAWLTASTASSKPGRPATGRVPGRSTGRAGAAIAEPRERAARAKVVNCILTVVVVAVRTDAVKDDLLDARAKVGYQRMTGVSWSE